MHRFMQKAIVILLLVGTIPIGFNSCVDEPQEGLRLMGAVVRKDCTEFSFSTLKTYGTFDIKVNEYARLPYYLDLWVMNDLPSNAYELRNRGEGNWVTIRRIEVDFEVPGGWPTDPPLPTVVIDRGGRLDPQGQIVFADVPVFSQQVIDTISTIYTNARGQQNSTVQEKDFASILLHIKVYGKNSA